MPVRYKATPEEEALLIDGWTPSDDKETWICAKEFCSAPNIIVPMGCLRPTAEALDLERKRVVHR